MSDGMALLSLGALDDPEAVHPNLERFGDAYRMALFVPMAVLAREPSKVLLFLEGQLGEILDLHTDPRGVFVFPEGGWAASTYDQLVEEVGSAGFWAVDEPVDVPEPEGPPGRRGAVLQAATEEAMAAVLGNRTPGAPSGKVPGEMLQVADRYDAVAAELEKAARHLRRTAEHFRNRDVPRASAHRVAADGHLIKGKAELDILAVLHAERARGK